MRILFVATRFPYPPERGDRLTVLQMLRAFSVRHRVHLACFTAGDEPPEAFDAVRAACEAVTTVPLSPTRSWLQASLGVFSRTPSQVTYYHSPRMHAVVRRLAETERFDAAIVHAIRAAPLVRGVPLPMKVLLQSDSVGLVLGRSVPFAPWWKRGLIRWERWRADRETVAATRAFDETWMLSAADQRDIVDRGGVRVALVPHGVDERLFEVVNAPGSAPRVMFLGNLSVPHNVDAAAFAAEAVWPHVLRRAPDARLLIVGGDAVPRVVRLGEREGVQVVGRVADLAEVWARVHVLLAPLRFSTGIQNKILEAMAAGVPVVTTPAAATAIEAVSGEHLLTAESEADLAAAVLRLLDEPELARRLAVAARAHVRARFSWQTPVSRLEDLVARAAAARAPERGAELSSARSPAG